MANDVLLNNTQLDTLVEEGSIDIGGVTKTPDLNTVYNVVDEPVIDIGQGQFTYNSTILPAILVIDAKAIYKRLEEGENITLKWTIYGYPTYLKVISSDYIAGTYSIDVVVHNQFNVTYSWADDDIGADPAQHSVIDVGDQSSVIIRRWS